MAPLVLEGDTLGEKHRHYNSQVKAAIADKTRNLDKINYDEPDANNLLRIDLACARKDVPYILDVLKCTDMLYVSRTVKQSVWLITAEQYAHIINPEYLNKELFPTMTAKAKSKILFSVRQHLKDEARIEAFYDYYKNDVDIALKWLPLCSVATIENFIVECVDKIDKCLATRLCKKSFTILKAYCKNNSAYYHRDALEYTMFYLHSHCDEYLDVVDAVYDYSKPKFKKNATQLLMNNSRDRIINKFEKYCQNIHMPTFVKNLKSEEVQEFLLKQKKNVALKYWFKFDNIKHFLKYIPKEGRLQFIKSLSMDKDSNTPDCDQESEWSYSRQCQPLCGMTSKVAAYGMRAPVTNAHIYRWYRYVPFNTALTDLKRLVHVESSPAERNAILTVLIKCAGSNQQHLQTLLEFYRQKHINEPFKFKVQFVNTFLSHSKVHELDDTTWNYLNNIFTSMEVNMESDNSVPYCVEAIVVYNVLRDQEVPEVIQKKFTFSTLKHYRQKLNESEKNKIFTYLFNHLTKTLQKQEVTSESEITGAVEIITNFLDLLVDWNKDLIDYPILINKIKELIKLKRQNSWEISLASLYSALKTWRKHLFEESLILNPTDEACLNALKHDPGLLSRYKTEVEAINNDDAISMKRVLQKMRIYWAESIAQQWSDSYLKRLEQSKGQKSVLNGICILVPRDKIVPLIEKYAPVEGKIDWNDSRDMNLNLRNHIAKNMQLVRPTVSLDTVLLYAKGDYLWHALPSLNAVLYNMSSDQTSVYITRLLDAPVSLQKHGICAIFRKLAIRDIKGIVENLWKNTKNSSIKTVLFQQTFKLLCKEKNDSTIKEIWELFCMYIDSLTTDENSIIYNTFGKSRNVPIEVRPLFLMKGYLYLKSLPAKAKAENIINNLLQDQAAELIHLLEPSFVEDVLLEPLGKKLHNFGGINQIQINILTSYILACKSEELQILRYEKLFVPILDKAFASWKQRIKGNSNVKTKTTEILTSFIRNLTSQTASKQNVIPAKLFQTIQSKLKDSLPVDENYELLMNWDLATLFVELVQKYLNDNPQVYTECLSGAQGDVSKVIQPYGRDDESSKLWLKICSQIAPTFGEACTNFMKQDALLVKYPALYTAVVRTLMSLCSNLYFGEMDRVLFIKSMLSDEKATTVACVVIDSMSSLGYSDETKIHKKEIRRQLRSIASAEVKIHMCNYESAFPHSDDEDDIKK